MKYIDDFLNSITMYRLVLYGLIAISLVGIILGFAGAIFYSGFSLLVSAILFAISCQTINILLAKLFGVSSNVESAYITALILFLIFPPAANAFGAVIIILASAVAMASKYLIAVHKKHIFNPSAFTAVVFGFSAATAASWWVGSSALLPFVGIIGLLIVRKIRRFDLFISFAIAAILTILAFGIKNGIDPQELLTQIALSWPIIFFGTVMLTEPQTTPPKRSHRIIYGSLVGILFGSQWNLGPFYPTPELALVIGNLFSYAVSFRRKLILTLTERKEIAENLYGFSFAPDARLSFESGQYLEWTLPKKYGDSRGNRRYFTIASSPTESDVKLGVKIPLSSPSRFKQGLLSIPEGTKITASQLSGDFTLPADSREKLVFVAGGIGVTPFRSMVKYLLDTGEKRDIVLFYTALSPAEFAYKDIFAEAEKAFRLKTVYVVTDEKNVPSGWSGRTGFLTSDMIKEEIPDYSERIFYLSGPQAMVSNYKHMLREIGTPFSQIKTDYFPGF